MFYRYFCLSVSLLFKDSFVCNLAKQSTKFIKRDRVLASYLDIWCQISNNFDVLLCNMSKYCSSFYINTFFLYKTLFTCLNATEEADPGEIVNPSSSGNGYVPRSCIETRIPASGARADMYSLCWILNSKVKPGRKKKYFKNPTTFCPMHYSQYIRHQWVNWSFEIKENQNNHVFLVQWLLKEISTFLNVFFSI